MHQKHLWRSVFFVKTSGKSSWILLKITLHKKCFWAFFFYINGNINIGKESKWCLYTEVGLRWPAHQIDVNLRRLPNFIKTYHEKMVPKQREKRGEAGRFYMQLYIWCVLRFEIISLITKFRKHLRGSVIFNNAAGLQLQLQWKSTPLELLLRFYIRANGLKLWNASHDVFCICLFFFFFFFFGNLIKN